jgi:hypothetical protein
VREIPSLISVAIVVGIAWLFWHFAGAALFPAVDWTLGVALFLWLLAIVTIPWNIHFQARDVIVQAELSRERGIRLEKLDEGQLDYARRWMQRSLVLAVALHLLSALAMAWLSYAGITPLGYWGAGAALLLTFARPVGRGYEYVRTRLRSIRNETLYPREDAQELRSRIETLENALDQLKDNQLAALERALDADQQDSLAERTKRTFSRHDDELAALRVALQELREANAIEHDTISRNAQNVVTQVMGDAAILNHVREIVRFFKQA